MKTTEYQEPSLIPMIFDYFSATYMPPDEIIMAIEDSIFDPDKEWDRKFSFYTERRHEEKETSRCA